MAPKTPTKKSESTKVSARSKTPTKVTTKDNTHNLIFLWTCFQSMPEKTVSTFHVYISLDEFPSRASVLFISSKCDVDAVPQKKGHANT